MYSHELISEIHHHLQKAFPHNTILLGGSYLYGEATEDSDIDFYAICQWRDIFGFASYRQKIEKLKDEFFTVRWNVTIVPQALYNQGWYYVYGREITGKIQQSAIYHKLIIRNSLKLAFFHYLSSFSTTSNREHQKKLVKSAQQLAAALLFFEKIFSFKPFFSTTNLIKQLGNIRSLNTAPLVELLRSKLEKTELTEERLRYLSSQLSSVLLRAKEELGEIWNQFSWVNYCLYNARFILKGNPLFLFTNPDKMVLQKLTTAVQNKSTAAGVIASLKEIVFPVIVV